MKALARREDNEVAEMSFEPIERLRLKSTPDRQSLGDEASKGGFIRVHKNERMAEVKSALLKHGGRIQGIVKQIGRIRLMLANPSSVGINAQQISRLECH
ncbi:hypothetical protein KOW79_020506 [Hemibagrus wyckioides]|uniref:Uncharacterized protein n=1 Tax=Hemibagrus wyckioides TaxID=337641 RepID=A0A9D3N4Y1_9TELE|nr:hypothetical protein KOW79_020506 [Hemibagrus wyckioides]